MSAPRWCCGYPPQPPHVPDDQTLIATNIGPNVVMCRNCWTRWVRTNTPRDEVS